MSEDNPQLVAHENVVAENTFLKKMQIPDDPNRKYKNLAASLQKQKDGKERHKKAQTVKILIPGHFMKILDRA